MSLEVDGIGKWYGQNRALEDVSLSVADGEFCIVLGPSGSGKTTLLMSVAGLVEPDAGDVRIDGESVAGDPVEERGFGVVFQDFEERLFPHMTVEENVAFGLRQNSDLDGPEIDDRVTDALELLAIEETRTDSPAELSGGQQQRVDLARQLVRDVETLLLDDPLSDLDYKLQKYLELELRRLQKERENTILYVTHNQNQSFKLADRLVVLNDGLVEQIGTPREVYHDPATAFVARFIGDSNAFVVDDVLHGNEGHVLETPLGEMAVSRGRVKTTARPDGAGSTAGPAGVAMVRPEDVLIGEGTTSVTGTLEQRTYTGEMTEFIFGTPGDTERMQVQRRGNVRLGDLDVAVGEEVSLGWEPEQLQFFDQGQLSAAETTIPELLRV